jgi:uncharacterized membrane protein
VKKNAGKAAKMRARRLMRGKRGMGSLLLALSVVMPLAVGASAPLLDKLGSAAVNALPAARTYLGSQAFPAMQIALALAMMLCAAILCAPLRIGREAWFVGVAEEKGHTLKRVLFWLQPGRACKAALFQLTLWGIRLLWGVVYFVPGAVLFGGTLLQAQSGVMNMFIFIAALAAGGILLLIGGVFWAATVRRYALVPAILVKRPTVRLRNALRLSAARMEGRCGELGRFEASLAGWKLAGLLIVPAVFAMPYVAQARVCRHLELISGDVTTN